MRRSAYHAGAMLARKPTEVLRLAVKGMLPKNRIGDALLRNIRIYADETHPHQAQSPQEITLTKNAK